MTVTPIAKRNKSLSASGDSTNVRILPAPAAKGIQAYATNPVAQTMTVKDQFSGLFSSYAPLGYYLPWAVLDYIELLATYNPDYSQAVDNIRTLANSGHQLFVDAKGTRNEQNLTDLLHSKSRTLQENSGGVDGIIDKLLDQAATYGAMCGEYILDEQGKDIVDFVDINPKFIRFFWEDAHWAPYQKINRENYALLEGTDGLIQRNGCVKLNELTFHYYGFDQAPGSPYGTPPFVAALGPIAVQRDMTLNMSQIVRKVGLLGIVDITVEKLPPMAGETPAQYMSRAQTFLNEMALAAEAMMRDGGIVHFDDTTATTFNITGNASGVTNIFKQNEEQLFSGLKSMPSVQGRSYSTTETYAGVAYDIIIRNTEKYQRACKRMIESGYWLISMMNGFVPNHISIKFNDNKTLNRLQNANAELIEIKNALMAWAAGFLDQAGAGQKLGYATPVKALDEPPLYLLTNAKSGSTNTDGGNSGDSNANSGTDGGTSAGGKHVTTEDEDDNLEDFGGAEVTVVSR